MIDRCTCNSEVIQEVAAVSIECEADELFTAELCNGDTGTQWTIVNIWVIFELFPLNDSWYIS